MDPLPTAPRARQKLGWAPRGRTNPALTSLTEGNRSVPDSNPLSPSCESRERRPGSRGESDPRVQELGTRGRSEPPPQLTFHHPESSQAGVAAQPPRILQGEEVCRSGGMLPGAQGQPQRLPPPQVSTTRDVSITAPTASGGSLGRLGGSREDGRTPEPRAARLISRTTEPPVSWRILSCSWLTRRRAPSICSSTAVAGFRLYASQKR